MKYEVRISAGGLDHAVDGRLLDGHAVRLERLDDRLARVLVLERAHVGEIEQPLGIGLRVAHSPAQLRQACPREHDRQPSLRPAMHRRDERRQFGLLHVLHLVHQDRQRGIGALRGQADLLEQRRQIVLEVAVVGEAGLGFGVDADLDVAVIDLQRLREARQRAKAALGQIARPCRL